MFASLHCLERTVKDCYLLFMALARLADWNGLPVGVIEVDSPQTKKFTLIIDMPQRSIGCVIPKNQMLGSWHQIPMPENVALFNSVEFMRRLKNLIYSVLVKTIHTPG